MDYLRNASALVYAPLPAIRLAHDPTVACVTIAGGAFA